MSAMNLFDRVYEAAVKRGHVVHMAAIGLRQLNIGTGETPAAAYATFRMAEQLVDAADDFHAGVEKYFRKTVKDAHGREWAIADTSCKVCGHPYCELYAMAGMLPKRQIPLVLVPMIG